MSLALIRTLCAAAAASGLAVALLIDGIAWKIGGSAAMVMGVAVLESFRLRSERRRWSEAGTVHDTLAALQVDGRETTDALGRATDAVKALAQHAQMSSAQSAEKLTRVTSELQQLSGELPVLQRQLASLAEALAIAEKNLAERVNAFAQGILEEVAQTQLDADRHARHAERHRNSVVRNVESLLAIYNTLQPDRPYPVFGGWAVSADAARRLVSTIFTTSPRLVVDIGSGVSTLLAAKVLQSIRPDGRVVALDHDERWAEQTRRLIAEHQLEHIATIIHRPLVDHKIGAETFQWYDLDGVDLPFAVDLLFIDGPPKSTGPLARYPALPLLSDRLGSDAVVLLDDADRPEEQEVLSRWSEEFPSWAVTMHDDEKGTAELRRTEP